MESICNNARLVSLLRKIAGHSLRDITVMEIGCIMQGYHAWMLCEQGKGCAREIGCTDFIVKVIDLRFPTRDLVVGEFLSSVSFFTIYFSLSRNLGKIYLM